MRGIMSAALLLVLIAAGGFSAKAGEECGKNNCADVQLHARCFGYLAFGGHLLDLTRLDSRLNALGLDDFKAYGVSFGVGRYRSIRRLVMDHELQSLFWRDRVAGNLRASLWTGYGLINAGVNLLPPGGRISVYPLVGIGWGLFNLDILDDQRTFEETVTGAAPAAMMFQSTFLANVGVGVDLMKTNEGRRRMPGMALRVGYTWDPTRRSQWWSNGTTITGGPAPLLTGPYARIAIGMGRPLFRTAQLRAVVKAPQTRL